MGRALTAGLLYFVATFAAGFLLGTIRALLVAPAIGETAAVAIEAPVMLLVAWIACGWAVRRLRVANGIMRRLAMGGAAFALLIAAEACVAMLLVDLSTGEWIAAYGTLPAEIGLAAQLLYAAFPLLRR